MQVKAKKIVLLATASIQGPSGRSNNTGCQVEETRW